MMTQSLAFARYYEAVRDAGAPAKLAANWLMGEISKRLNAAEAGIEACPVAPAVLAALIAARVDGTVSTTRRARSSTRCGPARRATPMP
jgi:aspartyl-tRNA(Asn)/glutamyl-tRNA(Gln) amidotransferase subunit B